MTLTHFVSMISVLRKALKLDSQLPSMEFHLTPTRGNDENDVEMLLPGIEVRVGVVEEVGVRLRDGMDGLTHQLDFFNDTNLKTLRILKSTWCVNMV